MVRENDGWEDRIERNGDCYGGWRMGNFEVWARRLWTAKARPEEHTVLFKSHSRNKRHFYLGVETSCGHHRGSFVIKKEHCSLKWEEQDLDPNDAS